MRWSEFARQAPRLAELLRARFDDPRTGRLSYLSTVRGDGGPRVHPVKVFLASGEPYVFMWSGSPKGADLVRDPRYAFHTAVTPNPFESGECAVRGVAVIVEDADERERAVRAAPFAQQPSSQAVCFRLEVQHVIASLALDGRPVRLRWRSGSPEEELPFPTDS
jgi:hypothetical protein